MKKMFLIILVFLFGLYIVSNYTSSMVEGFGGRSGYECPDIILKKGNKIFLKKSNKAIIPGVNPIVFDNLEDYVEFTEWQRSQNINCPVLYLEETSNAQGEMVYKMRPDMFNPQGGLNSYIPEDNHTTTEPTYEESLLIDAARNDPPYNKNLYPGFDPQNQYVGLEVPIDKMFHDQEKQVKSDNPMDNNWGGVEYSQKAIESGKYKGDNVSIYVD